MAIGEMTLGGAEYVLVPRPEYERLQARQATGRLLKAARKHANVSQAELAEWIRRSQCAVSGSEAGRIDVSEGYVRAVLKACELPADWRGPKG